MNYEPSNNKLNIKFYYIRKSTFWEFLPCELFLETDFPAHKSDAYKVDCSPCGDDLRGGVELGDLLVDEESVRDPDLLDVVRPHHQLPHLRLGHGHIVIQTSR